MGRLIDKETGQPVEVTPEGSLGLLALGYRGIMAWREARMKAKKQPVQKKIRRNNG